MAATVVLLLSVGGAPELGLWGLTVPIMAFTTAFGLVSPALQATALEHHGLRAGTAASLLGASNMAGSALMAPVSGLFGLSSAVPTAVVMLGCATVAGVLLMFGTRRSDQPKNTHR